LIRFDPVLPLQPLYYVVPDRRHKEKKGDNPDFD